MQILYKNACRKLGFTIQCTLSVDIETVCYRYVSVWNQWQIQNFS